MMNQLKLYTWATVCCSLFFVSSCDKDDDIVGTEEDDTTTVVVSDTIVENSPSIEKVYIVNEGGFGIGNGSVSYYDVMADTVYNNIYQTANGVPLGDVVQSVFVHGDTTYICVNNSNKVEVVKTSTFESIAQIEVANPRYAVAINDYCYVTSQKYGAYQVKVIDINTLSVVDSIDVGASCEQLAVSNGKLYVANGAWGADSTVTVIDLSSNTVNKTIDVGFYGPSALKVDSTGTVWVLAAGKTIYDASWAVVGHEPSALIKIDKNTDEVVSTIALFDEKHPSKMEEKGNGIYISEGTGIYKLALDATAMPSSPIITEDNYGFTINKESGVIFVLKSNSSANGTLVRYSAQGNKLNEFEVGVFPNGGTSGKRQLFSTLKF